MAVSQSVERLMHLIEVIPPLLYQISNEDFIYKPLPTRWSKAQILGHLIDSATNNHQRFVRIQYENEPVIFYDQNQWNEFSGYDQLPKTQIIRFWMLYNLHLVNIIKRIHDDKLDRQGISMNGEKSSLQFYVDNYVEHTEHHLKQLVAYE